MSAESPKVFFLGASKMGTSSIHKALTEANCRSIHNPKFTLYSHLRNGPSPFFETGDYFLDGSFQNFVHLQKWFPNAKYILLNRSSDTWLLSLFNWFRHIDNRHMADDKFIARLNHLFTGKFAATDILTTWLVYQKRARAHFQGGPDFLEINLERDGIEAWQNLSSFLGIELEPKWENIQSLKNEPKWLHPVIQAAEKRATHFQEVYPNTLSETSRNRTIAAINRILIADFYRERHLGRHLQNNLSLSNFHPWQASVHLTKFTRLGLCLALRALIIPSKILSRFVV